MDNDDVIVGRILSRRDAVRLLAVSGAAVLVGCQAKSGAETASAGDVAAGAASTAEGAMATGAMPACVVRPELTVGPYFVDKQLDRSDIRAEPTTGKTSEGVPLALTFNVSQISGGACTPLAGAMVDIWQCDANGRYSGVNDQMEGFDTQGQKFLRGYQVTDASGVAKFTTIYPGWYRGRTVHIHFKVRTPLASALANEQDKTYEFTSQLFFDEALNDRVFASAPYSGKGNRDTRNANDGIFREAGDTLLLAVAPEASGYRAAFSVGLDLNDAAVGRADRSGGRGPGGPPPGGRRGPPPGGRPPV